MFLVEKFLLYLQVPHGLSEPEFEEIMSRNRTVSSSAIARAVQVKPSQSIAFVKGLNTLKSYINMEKKVFLIHIMPYIKTRNSLAKNNLSNNTLSCIYAFIMSKFQKLIVT